MDKTYEDSTQKRFIQNLCYSQISGIKSNILCLAGPNPEIYVEVLNKYITTTNKLKIISYEQDQKIYFSQLQKQYSNKKLRDKITFRSGEILQAEPEQIIDLDFCQSLFTIKNTVNIIFNKQKQKYNLKNTSKVLMFTFSYLYQKEVNIFNSLLNFLKSLLKEEINFLFKIKMEYGVQYFVTCNKFVIRIMSYCDSSTLFVVQIIY